MNLREAAQQALEALEVADSWGTWHRGSEAITALRAALADTQDWNEIEALRESLREHMAEIHRLRAALAEATIKDNLTVEPVAYVTGFSKGYATVQPVDPCLLMCVGMALYRSPPKRMALGGEE